MKLLSATLQDDKKKLIFLICVLLSSGFLALSLFNYHVSKTTIRAALVDRELPLTSDNIYSEIQKDLIRPILISSMMAHDTFLRDWVLGGEREVRKINRYLREVNQQYGSFTAFFVSENSKNYYNTAGILKQVSPAEPRDRWYYRVRSMPEPYEINVDPDLSNHDEMTIFINYRVFDYQGQFIGATGIGLAVDSVRRLVEDYHRQYQRDIYFVNKSGQTVLTPKNLTHYNQNIRNIEGLKTIADRILKETGTGSYQYRRDNREHLLNVRFIPELQWYIFVDKMEDEALAGLRKTLWITIAVCLVTTLLILVLINITINYYQRRLEQMATTDALTGLHNRQSFELLIQQVINDNRRTNQPFAVILADVDLFKQVNDEHGHLTGDRVIKEIAATLQAGLRESDITCRWGGEEFLVIIKGCTLEHAAIVAENLRAAVASTFHQRTDGLNGITISLGVADFREDDVLDNLLARADLALYAAKNSGRNKVCSASAAVAV